MRTLPLLLAAGLLTTACSSAATDDDLAIEDSQAPRLGTSPVAVPDDGAPDAMARVSLDDLTEACTVTTDAAAGDVRLPFPDGWIVGECGFFDPDEVILDDDAAPDDVDITWYVDPVWFPTATEFRNDDHTRFTTTVSGLPAMRVAGNFPDDHSTSPGMSFVTWYVDISAGQQEGAQVLVGTVVEGTQVNLDRSVPVLDLMARGLAAQNPYEELDEDTHAVALRTSIHGVQATVTYDEGDCLTLRSGGASGEVVSRACDLVLNDDEAIRAVRLRWDDDVIVVAGMARADVSFVQADIALDDADPDTRSIGAIPVTNDHGPDVFAVFPTLEQDVPTLHAVGNDGEVLVKFDGDDVDD